MNISALSRPVRTLLCVSTHTCLNKSTVKLQWKQAPLSKLMLPPFLCCACDSQNASALCFETLSFMWLDFTIDAGMCSIPHLCSSALMHINYLMNSRGLEVESRWKFMNGGPCAPRSTTDISLYREVSSVTSPRTAPFRSMQWFAMKPSPH